MTHPALALHAAGRISPAVALARLVLDGMTADAIAPLLPPGSPITVLFAAQRDNLAVLATTLRDSGLVHRHPDDTAASDVAAVAAMFDRAVALSPEVSVAAYSLGDPGLLAEATAEIVDWLRAEAFARGDALDLGCGIGRVAAALAPHLRSVVGIDVSAGMVAEAGRRHAAPNLRFARTAGAADNLPNGPFDLVLAVDSMPYLIEAGLAHGHVAALRSRLRPGGNLVILNLSYRGEAADAADARGWADTFGFDLRHAGKRPFRLWDGAAFVLAAPP